MPALPVNIPPQQIGFDFDGVIADTAETFLRLACEQYGDCGIRLEDITRFEVEECLSLAPELVRAIFTAILENSSGVGLQPMDGAIEVLGELAESARLTVITARPLAEPVIDWLHSHLPSHTHKRIKVVAMGAHDDKARYIKAEGLRYFIDDRAETCRQLHAAGITSIVFSQPWNHGRHALPSVDSWQAIRALCRKEA